VRFGSIAAWWWSIFALLLITAGAQHELSMRGLRTSLIASLREYAEQGIDSFRVDYPTSDWTDPYYAGDNLGVREQGAAIYLLHHGYGDPALLRLLLLAEARRLDEDDQYFTMWYENYDLRRGLIRHCLADFPDDPRVQWAAGKLSLAAGEYTQAAAALGTAIRLAEAKPGGVAAFCTACGISPEHLRGRYACALAFTGQGEAARREWRLAGDPAAVEVLPQNPAGVQFDDELFTQRLARVEANKSWSRRGSAGHAVDEALLKPLLEPHRDWEGGEDAARQSQAIRQAVLRARLLQQDWPAVAGLLEQWHVLDPAVDPDQYPYHSQREDMALFVLRIVHGAKLGRTAAEEIAAWRQEVRERHAADGTPIEDWELDGPVRGQYSGWGPELAPLLASPLFAAAVRDSGRPLEDVLAEIERITQPERSPYFDNSNGKLRWH
jgi:hypothetical protein